MTVRVAHRREVNTGVNLIVDIVANASVVFSDMTASNPTYSIYNSGPVAISTTITSLTNLFVRLSMFTNTGDDNPRALHVSAVDIQVNGFNIS
jgi:hypothetical protein